MCPIYHTDVKSGLFWSRSLQEGKYAYFPKYQTYQNLSPLYKHVCMFLEGSLFQNAAPCESTDWLRRGSHFFFSIIHV